MANNLERFNAAKNMHDALAVFGDAINQHGERINKSRKKVNDIYAGITPDGPYIEYECYEGVAVNTVPWADTPHKESLNAAMQSILHKLNQLPHFDYIPSVGLPDIGGSGFIAGLFGTEYINLGANGLQITKHAISGLDEVGNLIPPVLEGNDTFSQVCERARFLAEALGDIPIPITYPQLQGPSTNALRVLPQEEGLVGLLTDPDSMEKLALMVTALITRFINGLFAAAGGPQYFRPRGRFIVPDTVKGLMVDDWISVVSPDVFRRAFASSYALMHRELGGIFLHTCGPTMQIADLLAELDGLVGLETVYVDGNSKTAENLLAMKAAAAGRYTFCSVGLPDGAMVSDEERLTPELVRKLSDGGKYMLHASGSEAYGERLAKQLGIH